MRNATVKTFEDTDNIVIPQIESNQRTNTEHSNENDIDNDLIFTESENILEEEEYRTKRGRYISFQDIPAKRARESVSQNKLGFISTHNVS